MPTTAKPKWVVLYTLANGVRGELMYARGNTEQEAIDSARQYVALEYFEGATFTARKPRSKAA